MLLADLRVIAATALGDVVQQHREIERAARDDRRSELGRERKLVLEQPALDLVQDADREERVLVDRVVVVHVVLHLSDDAPEIGDEAAKDPASFIRRSAVSGSLREVRISRNRRFASGFSRSRSSTRFSDWLAARSARGWMSSPCCCAT